MPNKKNILLVIVFTSLSLILIMNPNILIESVSTGMNLFINKLFVSLFPFFVLSEILINYNFHYYVSRVLKNLFTKIFKINSVSSTIIILSLLTGHPGNAKYIKDFLSRGIIDETEATKLLIFSFFPSPVFVITIVGFLMFGSIKIGIILLLIIYIINFTLGLIIRNKINIKISNEVILYKAPMPIGIVLKNSIINSFNTLLLILGNIIVFTIIFNIFTSFFHVSPILESVFASFIELTGGIKKISELFTNFNIRFSLSIFALIFAGTSIHSQIYSILSDYSIKYKKVFIYRLITAILSSALIYIILLIIPY